MNLQHQTQMRNYHCLLGNFLVRKVHEGAPGGGDVVRMSPGTLLSLNNPTFFLSDLSDWSKRLSNLFIKLEKAK